MNKPNCYDCIHRRSIPGDAHSSCAHPKTEGMNGMLAMAGILQLVREGATLDLDIRASIYGISKGWFMWPVNFDPVWLENCNGFEAAPESDPHVGEDEEIERNQEKAE